MNSRILLLTFLALAALGLGCEKADTTSRQLDKVQAETKQAAQELKDYTFAQKVEFTDKMRSQLAEINQDLDQLAAKIEKASDAAKAEAKPKLQTLRDQTAKLAQLLDKANSATESTWEEVKVAFKKGYSELKDGFTQARQWVSDKVAP